jgi:hypothetical protein
MNVLFCETEVGNFSALVFEKIGGLLHQPFRAEAPMLYQPVPPR